MSLPTLQPFIHSDWVRGKARGFEGVHTLLGGRECLAQRLVITSADELVLQSTSAVGFVLDREPGQPVIVVEGAIQIELGESDTPSSMAAISPLLTRWGIAPQVLQGTVREVAIADGDEIEVAREPYGPLPEGAYREAQGLVLRGTPSMPIAVRKI